MNVGYAKFTTFEIPLSRPSSAISSQERSKYMQWYISIFPHLITPKDANCYVHCAHETSQHWL